MRQLSGPAVRAVLSRETEKVFVCLMKIEHPDIDTIRICSDTAQVVRSDGTYLPYPFELILPHESETEIPRASVRLDNVSREIAHKLVAIQGKPKVTFMLVLADSPETVEYGPCEFRLADANWDHMVIGATLALYEDVFNQQVPSQTYLPSNSPGLFR